MKIIPAALQAHYNSGNTTVAHAILIARTDGQLYGFTSHDLSFTMDITSWGYAEQTQFVFDASQGLEASSIVTTAGLGVDNLELTTLNDGSLFTTDDILQGRWRNADFRIFRYNWSANPITITNDVETLIRGTFGEITLNKETVKLELRGLTQKLQQPIGSVSTKTCRARLGDIRCTKDLTDFTHTSIVSGVTSNSTFTAASLTQSADYFTEGILTWLTGNNAGVSEKIRSHATGGVFSFILPMVRQIQLGDTFTVVAGCNKTLETCRDKFNNVLNFQGEPHRPMVDALVRPVTPGG